MSSLSQDRLLTNPSISAPPPAFIVLHVSWWCQSEGEHAAKGLVPTVLLDRMQEGIQNPPIPILMLHAMNWLMKS